MGRVTLLERLSTSHPEPRGSARADLPPSNDTRLRNPRSRGTMATLSMILLLLANASCTTTGNESTRTCCQKQSWPPAWVQVPEWAQEEQEDDSQRPGDAPLMLVECRLISCPSPAHIEARLFRESSLAVPAAEGERLAETLSAHDEKNILGAPQVLVADGQHACVSLVGLDGPDTGIVWYLKPTETTTDGCTLTYSIQGSSATTSGAHQEARRTWALEDTVRLGVGVWCVHVIQAQGDEHWPVIMVRVRSINDPTLADNLE